MDKKIIALVPIKKHSERIANKNFRDFVGRSLYHHIIDSLAQSKYVKEIYINTDSDIIAEQAPTLSAKVKIIDRPKELRGDFISMNDIIAYDLSQIEEEFFLQTHATNPLLTTNTLNKAVATFFSKNDEFDSLFSVTKMQTRFYDKNGQAVNHNPSELIRTQDLLSLYEENSNMYIFTKDSFKNNSNRRIGKRPFMFVMDRLEAIDIDELDSFLLAEAVKKAGIIK